MIALALVLIFAITSCTTAPTEPPVVEPESQVISEEPIELVISTWGAPYVDFMEQYVLPELRKLYPNVSLVFDEGGMSARYNKVLSLKDNPEHDLLLSNTEHAIMGHRDGMLEPYDPANVPNAKNLVDWARPDQTDSVVWAGNTYGLWYNPDFFGDNPPTSWGDLWRPEVQGKIAVPIIGHSHMTGFMELIAEMNGGSRDNIEPALEALAELEPGMQVYTWTQWLPLYESGDIVLATAFDYIEVPGVRQQGYDLEWVLPEEGVLDGTTTFSIVKGSKNKEVAEAFLNILLSPEVQEQVPLFMGQTPVVKGVPVPDDLANQLPLLCCLDQVLFGDVDFFISVRPEWTELMNERVAPAWGE
jgi:putative spermidine/putrescine transport system substrate-binding protein